MKAYKKGDIVYVCNDKGIANPYIVLNDTHDTLGWCGMKFIDTQGQVVTTTTLWIGSTVEQANKQYMKMTCWRKNINANI